MLSKFAETRKTKGVATLVSSLFATFVLNTYRYFPTEATTNLSNMETPENDASVPLFDTSMKKKKKKTKKTTNSATATPTKETAVEEAPDETADGAEETELPEAPADGEIPVSTVELEGGVEEEDDMDMGNMPQSSIGMEVSATGDYTYDQLLKR